MLNISAAKKLEQDLARAREYAEKLYSKLEGLRTRQLNETELRGYIDPLLEQFGQETGLHPESRKEYTTAMGRIDTILGGVVIEYKAPGRLLAEAQKAIQQLQRYLEEIEKSHSAGWPRLMGIVLDGIQIAFLRKRENRWEAEGPLPVTQITLRQLFYALTQLVPGTFPLTADSLRDRFALEQYQPNALLRKLLEALARGLQQPDSLPAKLYKQWEIFFSQAIDYSEAFGAGKLPEIQNFAAKIADYTISGGQQGAEEAKQFFFVLHTYFALLLKLLAWLALSRSLGGALAERSFAGLAASSSPVLLQKLQNIEEGSLFALYGISNLLEGDFFRWYLEVWDNELAEAIRSIIELLSLYNPAPLYTETEKAQDLFKKLYQYLIPRELRHGLGEYYTPDWLADHLLAQVDPQLFGEGQVEEETLLEKLQTTRILDPACGSGTFLVRVLHHLLTRARRFVLEPGDLLENLTQNVIGFDINPLAVLTARVNYLFAISELIGSRKGSLNLPVFIADSVRMPAEGADLLENEKYHFATAVGTFKLPAKFFNPPERAGGPLSPLAAFATLCDLAKNSLKADDSPAVFIQKVSQDLAVFFPEGLSEGEKEVLQREFYEPLLDLHRRRLDGIWVHLLHNLAAPLVIGQVDYIVGNPPWINWEHLPDEYRRSTRPLWERYRILEGSRGKGPRLGAIKADIAALMTYVVADKLLRPGGRLGFVVTQSLFKTAGAGAGFRRFRLPDETPLKVLQAEDLVALNPFEGASNRTALLLLQKGEKNTYPLPYRLWRKKARGSISPELPLLQVYQKTERLSLVAEPVNPQDPTAPWLTVSEGALEAVRKVLGASDYRAREGVNTGGANAVYWVERVDSRPDGLWIVRNLTKGAKVQVEEVTAVVEPDLLYPLLRGRDVQRWNAQPSAWIIVPKRREDPGKAIPIPQMQLLYPKTYTYLRRFEGVLRRRAEAMVKAALARGEPFYFYGAVGSYTFAPWKVVWRGEVATELNAAVISEVEGKPVIPDQTAYMLPCESLEMAHFLCAILNSSPVRLFYTSHRYKHVSVDFVQQIGISRYDSSDSLHCRLAELSMEAHAAAAAQDQVELDRVEREIDEVAGRLWGLSPDEVIAMREGLEGVG